ncbi:ribonuclease H-like domain-containing protein [Tanacetum coccineum]
MINFFNENNGSLRSNDPYDDGVDSANNSNKSAPKSSVDSPNDSTVDDVAKDHEIQTDNSSSADLSSISSSRKVNEDLQYATETNVSEGVQGTVINDYVYESEGEEIEYFGQLFESPKPTMGQNVWRFSRKSAMPAKYSDYVLNKNVKYGIEKVVNYSELSIKNFVFTISLNKIHEPFTYVEAIKDSRWVDAMNQEIEALNRNKTWKITKLPSNRKAIESKWIWKVNYKASCEVERFKARLVTKDVNNVFLYGELEEDVHMTMPEGYSDNNDNRVCKLLKSLYGLKQALRKWNEKLTSVLIKNGFVQSPNDFSLFLKNDKDIMMIFLVYVDDIIVTEDNINEINKKYCTELLNEFGMLGCKPCNTPIEVNPDNKRIISKFGDDVPLTGITTYQKLVMHNPMQSHLRLAFRVLRYIKGEPGLGITFKESDNTNLRVFVDSNWAKCPQLRLGIELCVMFAIAANPVLHERSTDNANITRKWSKPDTGTDRIQKSRKIAINSQHSQSLVNIGQPQEDKTLENTQNTLNVKPNSSKALKTLTPLSPFY